MLASKGRSPSIAASISFTIELFGSGVSLIALHYQEARDLIIMEAASVEDFLQKRADNFILVAHQNPPGSLRATA